jgi:HTH-type transcriptional regulator, transcriptional repressor of NAD biosynthesis genes
MDLLIGLKYIIPRGGKPMSKVGFIGGKFLPLHMGHVYAITRAACLCDELYVILSHSRVRDKKLCENSRIKYIPREIRLRWLCQVAKDMENVRVIEVEDEYETDEDYCWEKGARDIRAKIGKPIDCIFSSETGYEEIFSRLYPEAEHIIIDSVREKYPISATLIRREGVFKHWGYVPEVVRPYFVKKVIISGTESCGKSTLTRYLAKLYNTTYVEEYGRLVCEEFGGCDGILDDEVFNRIAYGHKMLEYEAIKRANRVTFIDTEAIVTQYYSGLYLGKSNSLVEAHAGAQNYDLWIYLEPDVRWIDDGLRIHGENHIRQENNRKLKKMLDDRGIRYVTVEGSYSERLNRAMELVDKLLKGELKC